MSCPSCSNNAPVTLVYSCSGAADVGEITDRAARTLARDGFGKMSCATGVGAGVQSLRNGALSAGRVVAIDGCATGCVAKAMTESGVTGFIHVELGSKGFPKGASPATPENIARALEAIRSAAGSA